MLEIYEPEAEIVRTIFSQYLVGQSKDEIAAMVTTLGVPPGMEKDTGSTPPSPISFGMNGMLGTHCFKNDTPQIR